jgi:hypothetical protein
VIVARKAFIGYVSGLLKPDLRLSADLYYGAVAGSRRNSAVIVGGYDAQEKPVIEIHLFERVPAHSIRCLAKCASFQGVLPLLEQLEATEGPPPVYQLCPLPHDRAPQWYARTRDGQETLALRAGFTAEQTGQYLNTLFARKREPEVETAYFPRIEDAIAEAKPRATGVKQAQCVQFHLHLGKFFVTARPSVSGCVLMGMALHPGEFKHMAAESLHSEPMGQRLEAEEEETFYGVSLETVSVPSWLSPRLQQRTKQGRTLLALALCDAHGVKWEIRPLQWAEDGRPASLRLYHRIWVGDKRLSPHGIQDAIGTCGGVRLLIEAVSEYEKYDSTSKPGSTPLV